MFDEFFAHEPAWRNLEVVMRFQSVKRWHMIDTTRGQTLAEHSANVSLLLFVIGVQCPQMFFGPAPMLMAYGLLHDLPEVLTGDIPTMTKGYVEHLDKLEDAVLPKLFEVGDPLPHVKMLIKLCDLADGIRFMRLHGIGITADHAKDGLKNQLDMMVQKLASVAPPEVVQHVNAYVMFYAYEYS